MVNPLVIGINPPDPSQFKDWFTKYSVPVLQSTRTLTVVQVKTSSINLKDTCPATSTVLVIVTVGDDVTVGVIGGVYPLSVKSNVQEQGPPEEASEEQPAPEMQEPAPMGEVKNYMFFSSLKVIKKKVEELLQMDPHEIDAMLEDGHDWAAEHVITAKDDIEEVYNWIISKE